MASTRAKRFIVLLMVEIALTAAKTMFATSMTRWKIVMTSPPALIVGKNGRNCDD